MENCPAGKSPSLPRSSRCQGRSPALAGAERQRSALTAESRGVAFPTGRAVSTIVVRHRFTPPASAIGAPAPPSLRAASTTSPPTSEPQELPAATLDTIRHHEYHLSARRSTPTPPEPKHEHHPEPCPLYPSPDTFAPSEHHGPCGPAHLPRLPRRAPGCIGARAACQDAYAGLRPLSRPPRIRRCPVPARLRCPSRQGFAGPLRLVKAEPATLNSGGNHDDRNHEQAR